MLWGVVEEVVAINFLKFHGVFVTAGVVTGEEVVVAFVAWLVRFWVG